jgi:hypothetical protein
MNHDNLIIRQWNIRTGCILWCRQLFVDPGKPSKDFFSGVISASDIAQHNGSKNDTDYAGELEKCDRVVLCEIFHENILSLVLFIISFKKTHRKITVLLVVPSNHYDLPKVPETAFAAESPWPQRTHCKKLDLLAYWNERVHEHSWSLQNAGTRWSVLEQYDCLDCSLPN